MVYRPLIGQVDVWILHSTILHSTWLITTDWLNYILSIAFGMVLAIQVGGSGRGLENDKRQMSNCRRQRDPMSKLTQVCSTSLCGWCGA